MNLFTDHFKYIHELQENVLQAVMAGYFFHSFLPNVQEEQKGT